MELPKILIAIPMKNASEFLDSLAFVLKSFNYPRDRMNLSILESDSEDKTWERVQEWKQWEGKYFNKVYLKKRDFSFKLGWDDRHAVYEQRQRIENIAKARDLVLEPLTDEEFILMMDSDIVNFSDRLPQMVERNLDVLCPIPLIYDKEKKLRIFNGLVFLRRTPFKIKDFYENYSKEDTSKLYLLDEVSTTAVLIKSEIIRRGAKFEKPNGNEEMKPLHPWEQAWFAERVKKLGYKIYLDPSVAVLHGGRLVFNRSELRTKKPLFPGDQGKGVVDGKNKVSIWSTTEEGDGKLIKVVTIEQGKRKPSMCDGCPAPCSCRGPLKPVLNAQEFIMRHFDDEYTPLPDWLKAQGVEADFLVTLKMNEKGCPHFDEKAKRCKLWPDCPASCKAYDCREDDRPEIRAFAKKREKEWRKHRKERLLYGRNS